MIIDYRGQRIEFPDDMPMEEVQNALAQLDDESAPSGPKPSAMESFGAGAASGATLGFNDEMKAALGAMADAGMHGGDFSNYARLRDAYRQEEALAQEANPGAYLGGALAGGFAVPLPGGSQIAAARTVPRLAAAMAKQGALAGGAIGLGTSEADLTQGDIGGALADTAMSAGLGAGLGAGVGGVLFPATRRLANEALLARGRLNARPVPPSGGPGGPGGGPPAPPLPPTPPAPPAGLLAGLMPRISPASAEYQGAVELLQGRGIPLTRGQTSGSNFLKMAESTLADTIGGGPLQRQSEAQRMALQKAMLGMAGHPDPGGIPGLITPGVIGEARENISKQYEQAFRNTMLDVNEPNFLAAIDAAERRNARLLPFEQKQQISDIVNEFRDLGFNSGTLTGEEYQRLRSELGRRATASANQTHSALYLDLKRALDEAFAAQTGIDMRPINARHAAAKTLEEVASRMTGPMAAEGMLNPLVVARAAVKKGTTSDDFEGLMRAAAIVLPDRTANSGTAQRQTVTRLLSGPGQLVTGGVAGALGGVPAVLATAGGARLASSALANPNAGKALASAALDRTAWLADAAGRYSPTVPRAARGYAVDELSERERNKRRAYLMENR